MHFDAGRREGFGTTGVVIPKPGITAPIYAFGKYDKGSSSNHAGLYAALKGFKLIVSKR